MHIYIAGPYSIGNVRDNIRNAVRAADLVIEAGHVPFLPHLSHFWDLISPKDYEEWISYDLRWLEKCEALIRLPGESRGADREVQRANELGLMVWYAMDEFLSSMWNTKRA